MLLSLAVRITNAREMIRGFTRVRVRTPRERARESARARISQRPFKRWRYISDFYRRGVPRYAHAGLSNVRRAGRYISVFIVPYH
jgi:hypothetical protein